MKSKQLLKFTETKIVFLPHISDNISSENQLKAQQAYLYGRKRHSIRQSVYSNRSISQEMSTIIVYKIKSL